MRKGDELSRCAWSTSSELMTKYHDEEWGVPLHDDRGLFEFLILEGAQAGLSWSTILNKRENYRKAFNNFDPAKVANYDEKKVNELLQNQGIIRNKLKVNSAIKNARAFLDVQKEFGSFSKYIWGFVRGTPKVNKWKNLSELPAETEISRAMSKDLKNRRFNFVGPTICYAFMQAVGMVNDHEIECFRHAEMAKTVTR